MPLFSPPFYRGGWSVPHGDPSLGRRSLGNGSWQRNGFHSRQHRTKLRVGESAFYQSNSGVRTKHDFIFQHDHFSPTNSLRQGTVRRPCCLPHHSNYFLATELHIATNSQLLPRVVPIWN